jgi:hypothetical protein
MSMRARIIVASALVIVTSATAPGCSSSGSSSKSGTGTTGKNKTYELSTSEGQVSVSLDGQLPPNWPTGFPVAPGAKAAGSGSLAGKSERVMVGVYTLSGSAEDAYTFYKNNSNLTVESLQSVGAGNAFVGTVKLGGTYSGLVTVGDIGGTAGIVVILDSGASTSSTTGGAASTSTT